MKKQDQLTPFELFFDSLRKELPALGDIRRTFRERPTTFRVNTLKTKSEDIFEQCQREGIKLKRVAWSKDAFIVPDAAKREVEALRSYERGEIYLQSLASQVPPLLLGPQPGDRILDLCAAPGGKTAQIAALMKGEGQLIAVEKDKIRAERLKFNLERQGVMNAPKLDASVIVGDALSIEIQEKFDRVLLDAPCSGEARFIAERRETWRHWRKELVLELAKLQKALILKALDLLKPNGTLVYSTCTFGVAENELVVAEAIRRNLKSEPWPQLLKTLTNIPAAINLQGRTHICGYRLKPSEEIEGFFVSKFS